MKMPLYIQEVFVNETKGYRFGETEWSKAYTDDRAKLFVALQKEYGQCAGHIFVDRNDGSDMPVGWIFSRKMEYDDSGRHGRKPEFYIREVWVYLSTVDPRTEEECISPWQEKPPQYRKSPPNYEQRRLTRNRKRNSIKNQTQNQSEKSTKNQTST